METRICLFLLRARTWKLQRKAAASDSGSSRMDSIKRQRRSLKVTHGSSGSRRCASHQIQDLVHPPLVVGMGSVLQGPDAPTSPNQELSREIDVAL